MRHFSRHVRKHYPELGAFLARVRRKDPSALWFANSDEHTRAEETLGALQQDLLDSVFRPLLDARPGAVERLLRAIEAGPLNAFLLGLWLGQLQTAGLRALLVRATLGQLLRPNPN